MELENEFNRLEQDYHETPYLPLAVRYEQLQQLKKALQKSATELAIAVSEDFSYRVHQETYFLELFPIIKTINYCLAHLRRWMKRRKRHVSLLLQPASAYIIPQPLGVVGVIAPWNYPLYLAMVPLIYAIAAGNRVMVKMSELSPQTGKALKALLENIEPLRNRVRIINGDVEVAKAFSALYFKHLLFTGSTNVGKKVMQAASHHLTPITLELGGKSPAVVSKTVRKNYLERLFMGKLINAGQTCVAPDYLLIPEGWKNEIRNTFQSFINTRYPNLPENYNYSSIISENHMKRLLALLDDAKEKGAEVIEFGKINQQARKLPVYLLFNVNSEMEVMQEEIFGPLLPVLTYKKIEDAIEVVNTMSNPLVLYYFGEDNQERRQLELQTLSGGISINDTITYLAADDLPFGGVGYSGMGHYHGREGFDTFSKLKPIFKQYRLAPTAWFYPPYGKLLNRLLRWVGGIQFKEKE